MGVKRRKLVPGGQHGTRSDLDALRSGGGGRGVLALEDPPHRVAPKLCCYCGRPALKNRAWCRPCLNRVRYYGCCDIVEVISREEADRAKEPDFTWNPWRPGDIRVKRKRALLVDVT